MILHVQPPKFFTASLPLKNGGGWKTKILSYWVSVTFQERVIKVREGIMGPLSIAKNKWVNCALSSLQMGLFHPSCNG